MAPSVLVIILNWRQAAVTLACVTAVRQMTYQNISLLVIDNGSGDESAEQLAAHLDADELLALPENLGFAGGCNVGLKTAVARGFEYALLLNNDAFPAPDMLTRLVAATAADVGLVSPRIYYEAEPGKIWFANGRRHSKTLDLRDTGRGEWDYGQFARVINADYLLGTCLLVNLAAVARVGLMDERYFMYYEDLDWSIRFRERGYRLKVQGDAKLYHRVAVSTGGLDSPTRRYHLASSSIIFWRKHGHLGMPLLIFLVRLGSGIKTVLRLALQGKTAVARAYIQGTSNGLTTDFSNNSEFI